MSTKNKPKPGKKRAGRGTLFLISLLFFASIITRILGGSGALLARETVEPAIETTSVPPETNEGYSAEQLADLYRDLRAREKSIETKEAALKSRMQALAVAEVAYKKSIKDLTESQASLRATMALANTAAEDDLARLTSVYESMKPKDAAAVFEQMAPDFAAGFLGRMRPESAAAVMAGLSPNTAYSISVILAGRNAATPTE